MIARTTHPRILYGTLAAALVALTLAGCIEREETITVEADGTVKMELAFQTNSFDELYAGDAVPSLEGGWVVEETREADEDGEETLRLEAEAMYLPGAELPSSYASIRDVDGDAALLFPTTLTIENRRDGTYYHFYRRYVPRPWAFHERARQLFKEEMEKLEGKSFQEMTIQERTQVVWLLGRLETARYEALARWAFNDVLPDGPQDAWLHARAALHEVYEQLDPTHIVELMGGGEDGEIDETALAEEAEAFEANAITAMQQALREKAQISAGKVTAFARRFNWHKRYYEITEELADDGFAITLRMPGEIVGHNGARVTGDGVVWEFTGEMLRDNAIEIMITSRLPR